MATLALSAIGAAAGSAVLPGGLSLFGATLSGATLGSQVGALLGSQIDQALFGASGRVRAVDGPRLSDLRITASTEGSPIPRVFGRVRVGGQMIWASNLEEEAVTTEAAGGGKGARSGGGATATDYRYYANFAIALCEGPITSLGRVWADGTELDLSRYTWRLYDGSDTQLPDALIEARQGAGNAPAYRGTAYIVFERMPLADFGNRIPQLSFELWRAVDDADQQIRGVCLIPGSGEFVYSPTEVDRVVGRIRQVAENVNTRSGATDWTTSLDQLSASLPNANSISLIVSWFGTDLRAGFCQVRPGVESLDKVTTPQTWSVAGITRSAAHLVSRHEGRAAYGGTPSDRSVVDAIRDLKSRGRSVVLSPFILMDVPVANTLPDPYSAASSQPSYPWRGRITQHPAAGRPGSPDKTAAAASQVASFLGAASPAHFALSGDTVLYSGPAEWSFRRFILHYAHLAKAAGGVDAFVLCSELRGLTSIRSAAGTFPFVSALVTLAAEVRAILGPATRILYAADWSEYFGHQPADGSGDVLFHLDPLWSSPHIDAIGLDVYWPLADWRDGTDHHDARAGVRSIHDLAYLKSNLASAEGYDRYYASDADRAAQVRTPITDGLGKPWTFRFKDLVSWWSNAHKNRIGGVEAASPTAWVPRSKPFWFMEIGCPAVDKGANQPNVFIDPKSSKSFLPHFSVGARDDFMQRRLVQAFTEAYDPTHPGFVPALNPVSPVYGGRMVDPARIHVYCWDARPYPAFPNRIRLWGDGANWPLGHWLNGRVASVPLPSLVARLLADYGFDDFDVSGLSGSITGFVIDRIMSAREALQPLELAGFFDAVESEGRISFRSRGRDAPSIVLTPDDLVETSTGADLLSITRAQETDLPAAAKLTYLSAADYEQAVAESRRQSGASKRVSSASLALVLEPEQASAIAETWLFEAWAAREKAAFVLPPSALGLEPGDIVEVASGSRRRAVRITEVSDHGPRRIDALSIDPDLYRPVAAPARPIDEDPLPAAGAPLVMMLDVPPDADTAAHAGLVAIAQDPWPGTMAIYRSPELAGFGLVALASRAAVTGITETPLRPGPLWYVDGVRTLDVTLDRGSLRSVTRLQLLAGANTAAIEVAPTIWEVIQFETAALIAPGRYRLSGFLRGQRGTEQFASPTIAAGARFVMLDDAVTSVAMSPADAGLPFNWRVGPAARDIGDQRYTGFAHTFRAEGLRPLAPVHIRSARSAAGDVTVTWKRRTRISGDGWDGPDVPLGEESERYVLDVLAGTNVMRSIETATASATITAAMQTADFGSLQPAISVRIAQVSTLAGPGKPRSAMV